MKKQLIKDFLNLKLSKYGFKIESNFSNISRLNNVSSHKDFLLYISEAIKINNVYDIGSNQGWWSNLVQFYLPKSFVYMFDPNLHPMNNIDWERAKFINTLLSCEQGLRDFYSINGTGDSYYKENSPYYDNVEPRIMRTDTLTNLSSELNIPYPDLIKIDTQGSELDILNGGKNLFLYSKFIICEVPYSNYNSGAPDSDQYFEFFNNHGFIPISVLEAHFYEGTVHQLDVAFKNIR